MDLVLTLLRDTYSREMGTFGTLSAFQMSHKDTLDIDSEIQSRKVFECETVERPWANNTPYVSCIPNGDYPLRRRWFYRGDYETLELENVPGRIHILIHRGNVPSDVQGCIALGTERGVLLDKWAVLNSAVAFESFWKIVENDVWEEMAIQISQYVQEIK